MDTKFCTKCETEKKVSYFGKRSASADGLRSWCSACYFDYMTGRQDNDISYLTS